MKTTLSLITLFLINFVYASNNINPTSQVTSSTIHDYKKFFICLERTTDEDIGRMSFNSSGSAVSHYNEQEYLLVKWKLIQSNMKEDIYKFECELKTLETKKLQTKNISFKGKDIIVFEKDNYKIYLKKRLTNGSN